MLITLSVIFFVIGAWLYPSARAKAPESLREAAAAFFTQVGLLFFALWLLWAHVIPMEWKP